MRPFQPSGCNGPCGACRAFRGFDATGRCVRDRPGRVDFDYLVVISIGAVPLHGVGGACRPPCPPAARLRRVGVRGSRLPRVAM